MLLNFFDLSAIILFAAFVIFVIIQSWAKRNSYSAFFNAGSNLHWIFIGMSLLTADITIEYIISAAGEGYTMGLPIASYEWTASITLIIVSLFITPLILRTGILTLPEFLEFRYNQNIRLIVAVIIIVTNLAGLLVPILFVNGIAIAELMNINPWVVICLTGLVASTIIFSGGLSSKVRIDLVIGLLFLAGALLVTIFSLIEIGGFEGLSNKAGEKLNSVLPYSNKDLPWTTVFFGGLWVAHFFYWGFNQHIAQTVLVSQTLSQAQKGMLFVASVKLLLPFLLILPGIVAFEIFGETISESSMVLPKLIERVVPNGFKGFILVAYFGTVIAALNAVLNASTTIFTHDIFKVLVQEDASPSKMIYVARITNIIILVVACLLAPLMDTHRNIFEYSQVFASTISPIFLAVFLFGIFSKRTPTAAATTALIAGIPLYFIMNYFLEDKISSLDIAGVNFILLCMIMGTIRIIYPLQEPVVLPEKRPVKFEKNIVVVIWSIFIITGVLTVYIMFL